MTTKTFRRTSCGNCGKITEHETAYPEGWGSVELRWRASSGYPAHVKEISSVCPDCMRAIQTALDAALTAARS